MSTHCYLRILILGSATSQHTMLNWVNKNLASDFFPYLSITSILLHSLEMEENLEASNN